MKAAVLLLISLFTFALLAVGSHGHLMFRPHMTEDWVFWSIIVWTGIGGLALLFRDLRRWQRER
jgi:hypothetical protein